jgi:hypothetical protein
VRKRLGILLATLALGVSGLLFATPAQAAVTDIVICNDGDSVDYIYAFNLRSGYGTLIRAGQCTPFPDSSGGYYNQARVDVDVGGSLGDVDSWHKRKNNGGWVSCYNNEDESSDPYSDANGTTTTYETFSHTGC